MKSLSSKNTRFYKYQFSKAWIYGFGIGVVILWMVDIGWEKWLVTLLWALGSTWIYFSCIKLSNVSSDGENLIINDFSEEVVTPISNVESVKLCYGLNNGISYIKFKEPVSLGDKVIFLPKQNLFGLDRQVKEFLSKINT